MQHSTTPFDGSFEGAFAERASLMGIQRLAAPNRGHNQIGDIERHNDVWRSAFHKVMDKLGCTEFWQIELCAGVTSSAKNRLIRRCGRPPEMAVFGRLPRIPHELLSDEASMTTWPEASEDARAQMPVAACSEAIQALARAGADRAFRTAAHREDRAANNEAFGPGQKCAFYRDNSEHGLRRKFGTDGVARGTMRPRTWWAHLWIGNQASWARISLRNTAIDCMPAIQNRCDLLLDGTTTCRAKRPSKSCERQSGSSPKVNGRT